MSGSFSCLHICLGRLTGVEGFHEIKLLQDLLIFLIVSGTDQAHILFSERMGRSQNSSEGVDDKDQQGKGHPPQLKNPQLYIFRHNYQHMARVDGVILNSLQHHEILVGFPFNIFLPFPVAVITVVVCHKHSVIAKLLEPGYIILYAYLSIQRSLFCMAMHI